MKGTEEQKVISGVGKVFTGTCQIYIRSQVRVRSRDSVIIALVPVAAHLQFLSWVVAFRAIQVTLILIDHVLTSVIVSTSHPRRQ
jgi:hypothetical protein